LSYNFGISADISANPAEIPGQQVNPSSNPALDELAQQALQRIEQMEAPDYVFPERFSRADWTGAVLVIAITGTWLIAGNWM